MKKQKLGQAYRKFELAEGNQHIASEFAVEKLSELITRFKTKKILEVGLGIGSISGTILDVKKNGIQCYSGTENNSFCLEALKRNLGPNYNKVNIYSEIKQVPEDAKFDLIIIDGKDKNLKEIKKLVSSKGIIAIEGDRLPQQKILKEIFPYHKYVHSISSAKNEDTSPFSSDNWQGGVKIIFTHPNDLQKLWWIKEMLLTKLKYFYREFKI